MTIGFKDRAPFRRNSGRRRAAAWLSLCLLAFAACSSPPPKTEGEVTRETKTPLPDPATAAASGKPLFAIHCAGCHGNEGKGDGIASASLPARPADLSGPATRSQTDGELFLILKNGKLVDGKITMPPTRRVTDEQLWQLVAYLRTLARPE